MPNEGYTCRLRQGRKWQDPNQRSTAHTAHSTLSAGQPAPQPLQLLKLKQLLADGNAHMS